MVINALNSGANCYKADFEDSTAPTWARMVEGQRALREAVAGTLAFTSDAGKAYALKPFEQQAVLIVRPRGWHLDEKHVLVDEERMSASLFDLGLFAFHNSDVLAARSEEHTSELQSLMRISYAVFCLKNKHKLFTILLY